MQLLFTITAKQISYLRGISYTTARKEYKAVRDVLALDAKAPLKLRDLAAYWDICPNQLAQTLYNFKPN